MTSRKTAAYVFLLVIIVSVIHMGYYYRLLPDKVASHFDASGKANGWSTKGALLCVYSGVTILMALSFFGVSLLFLRLPSSMLNLPNKSYWLAPEHKGEAAEFLSDWLYWLGSATVAFLVCLMHLTFQVNLGRTETLSSSIWPLSIGYLVFVAAWTVRFYRYLTHPKNATQH